MAPRLLISDALWSTIEPVLREFEHAAGSPPKLSDRRFIETVLYQARTGTPWRDLPDEFSDWNAVYRRFRRWEKRELWKRLWQRFQRKRHGWKGRRVMYARLSATSPFSPIPPSPAATTSAPAEEFEQ